MELLLSELLKAHQKYIADSDLYELIDYGREYTIRPNEKIKVEDGMLYLILSGSVSMEYLGTRTTEKNNNFFGLLHEGMIIGVIEKNSPEILFEYRAQSDVSFVKYPAEFFFKNLEQGNEKSPTLVNMLFYMISFLACFAVESSSDKSYYAIRTLIYRYNERQALNFHMNESLIEFISRRSNLSKSYIFKIISDLKKGGYITVQSGILESINIPLPVEY